MEQQPGTAQVLPKQPVVATIAIGGITDDRMEEVLQMPTDLVSAASAGLNLQQRVAGRGKFSRGKRQFGNGQPLEGRDRLLVAVHRCVAIAGIPFGQFPERVVDDGLIRCAAADHGQVGFFDGSSSKRPGSAPGRFRRQTEEEDARGGPIQAVYRVNVLTDLISRQLQGKFRFMPVQVATVDEQPGRLVDRQVVLVTEEDVKSGS